MYHIFWWLFYHIGYKQILKIIELDIKDTHHFNEDKQLVHSETCSGTQLHG